jgi:hypothetical protein
MTLTGLGSLFESRAAYEASLEQNIKKLSAELPGGLAGKNFKKIRVLT